MSASEEFVAYVQELFTPLGSLHHGKFFGGHAMKHGGKQFAMIMGNTLYFRVSEKTLPEFERKGSLPFSYSTRNGVVQVRKYYSAPEELFEDQDLLLTWARQAIHASTST